MVWSTTPTPSGYSCALEVLDLRTPGPVDGRAWRLPSTHERAALDRRLLPRPLRHGAVLVRGARPAAGRGGRGQAGLPLAGPPGVGAVAPRGPPPGLGDPGGGAGPAGQPAARRRLRGAGPGPAPGGARRSARAGRAALDGGQ